MRVGIIAIQHESNTFIPARTTLADFRRVALATGEAVREEYRHSHHEVAGFFAGLAAAKLEAVPLLATQAVPGGIVEAAAVEHILAALDEQLDAAGPLDGLLVAPHGAGVSETDPDLDGFWLTRLRARVGADIPIICTLDPHANLSPRMLEACDATIAYRTNPHLDQKATGQKAAALLARTLRGEVEPVQAAAMPPVAISIDCQATAESPCRELYALADEVLAKPGVLSDSVLLGFPYADVAEMGSSFVVVADRDRNLAQSEADRLAQHLVDHREDFACNLPSIGEALEQAAAASERVCLLDVGDNVGGGSPGDGTALASAIHEKRLGESFVCLYDPAAVQQARDAGVGAELALAMGGRGDPLQGPPLQATVCVESLHDGHFTEPEPRHGGRVEYDMGPTAVVRTDSGLTVMLISQRIPPFSLRQMTGCGLDPTRFRTLIAKGVNAPIAAYGEVCPRMIRVATPGVTCADMTQLPFHHRRQPLYPFER